MSRILLCCFLGVALVGGKARADNEPVANAGSGIDMQRILYLAQAGNINAAIESYKEFNAKTGLHHYEVLQNLGLILLDQGYRSSEPTIRLSALLGAGISAKEEAFYIIEAGLNSELPQLQLASLSLASKFQTDTALEALQRLMGSNYAILRFEAALILAENKHPRAASQIESLMSKVTDEVLPVFPPLFAMIGDPPSMRIMKKLISHPNPTVRLSCILSAAQHGRDDLLPNIRMLASQPIPIQQEACAFALGSMKDEQSAPRLEQYTQKARGTVRLAALKALYDLGRTETRLLVEKEAEQEDLFAIGILQDMPGSEDLLAELTRSPNPQVRLNAGLALLQRHDRRALPALRDVFFKDARDLEFVPIVSDGKALNAWKMVPNGQHKFADNPGLLQKSLELRCQSLVKAAELPEKDFIHLARQLFVQRQDELVPILSRLLENLETEIAVNLLKEQRQRLGAPLIRNYCNLALYRMRLEGPWKSDLVRWLTRQQESEMIDSNPVQASQRFIASDRFRLSRQDTAKLLTEAFESVAQQQEDHGIEILLDAIQYGHKTNKYALAGLLIRSAQ